MSGGACFSWEGGGMLPVVVFFRAVFELPLRVIFLANYKPAHGGALLICTLFCTLFLREGGSRLSFVVVIKISKMAW